MHILKRQHYIIFLILLLCSTAIHQFTQMVQRSLRMRRLRTSPRPRSRTLTTILLAHCSKTKSATAASVQAEPISPTAHTAPMAAVIASPDRHQLVPLRCEANQKFLPLHVPRPCAERSPRPRLFSARAVGDKPQKNMRVKQQFHQRAPSRSTAAAISSSIARSSSSVGIRQTPFFEPMRT